MTDPFVVIGGDAAGLSAASKLKREAPERDVIVFEKGGWVSYAHCGMPYYVKGEVDALTDLLSLSPEDVEDRGIDLRRGHEVVAVSPDDRTVMVESGDERFDQPYGDLLVATGGRALTLPFDGTALDGAFTMHDLDSAAMLRAYLEPAGTPVDERFGVETGESGGETDDSGGDSETDGEFGVDAEAVRRYAEADPPETVGIVGGGYVGVEMAEAFSAYDCDVHLFQRSETVLPPFGEAVGKRVIDHLDANDVALHLGTEVTELTGETEIEAIAYEDGDGDEALSVDAAVVGVGIRPNTEFLDGSGIELGDSGAVAIDDYGRTTRENVYAAGDCAEMRHAVTGESAWVPLGLTANRAGRAIGQTIAGDPTPVGSIAGTAVVKAFELECGRTGLVSEAEARDAGFDPVSETITAASRSGYYPGGDDTTVTLTADQQTGRLLGGSIVGRDRAAIRIDTLATALEADLSVAEVEQLDLAYAPPFSPVWDPILTAAKVLNGQLPDADRNDE